ncbi:MAG: dTDP-glucose 4,6-dehydratase [Verrucomicrobia bacterium]|nr:dTDP-glucose 4,6-dehydratase [Verrucomicrobiota bacterium]MBU4247890.1 dTDP-glucose 4,6-dehydratase [Verrucomicrobiota bacterium]MBU4292254.1 dTDP-glucose 4,6-dehydratase [Verrucomicrobiota bacterium]MBU4427977.1 dTDP-glucose 4,6-dehydratase [Verrucomicrobiota bacterium]MBU4498032.1 dTDP-glucose 4,6-dehydratase [Verrucomicrobiota bacterium]
MKLLVTGGAGFIGSNYIHYILAEDPEAQVVNFDALTYAGNLENLAGIDKDPRYTFIKGDITKPNAVAAALEAHQVDAVVHFAAESHVDRSLHVGTRTFILTNVLGTQNLLDACRAHKVARFVHVSTDEVYGSLGPEGRFTEASPIQPNNPYAATKAASDFMVRAACHSHGLDAVITRCSNNFGPYQFPEKLIPLMIANALEDKPLPVYGDGCQVRDWIYVEDHCRGVDAVLRKGKTGEIYNIGGSHDVPNLDVVRRILAILQKPESLIKYVKDRPGHDRRYAIDASKIERELGWQPRLDFDTALRKTVAWYLEHRTWWERIRSGEYRKYYAAMYGNR